MWNDFTCTSLSFPLNMKIIFTFLIQRKKLNAKTKEKIKKGEATITEDPAIFNSNQVRGDGSF
jgi:hypothetical protein